MPSTPVGVDELPGPMLVRRQTDRLVLDALLAAPVATRPDIARSTGVSKPTVSESVHRLESLGLVVSAGKNVGGRGRSGVRYALSPTAGVALALHAGPGGVLAQSVDVRGAATPRISIPLGLTASGAEVAAALTTARERAAGTVPVRAIVTSVADPVDAQGRALLLPGSPFLTEPLDVASLLGPGAVVGNDVNWAALAEAEAGAAGASFLYCYLGAGIGGAIVEEGRVRTGVTGLAGELAYVATRAADGSTASLLESLLGLGLGLGAGGSALDVPAIQTVLATDPVRTRHLASALGVALASAAIVLGADRLVLGGPWGSDPGLVRAVGAVASAFSPRPVDCRAATVQEDAPLAGARLAAREKLLRWLYDTADS